MEKAAPGDIPLSTTNQTVGYMGESLVAFLLEQECRASGLGIVNIGDQGLPYDLVVLDPKGGTPFPRPAAISVKNRMTRQSYTPPTRQEFLDIKGSLERRGYDYWIAFIKCWYKERHLRFTAHLTPSSAIDDGDFVKIRSRGREQEFLRILDLKAKARLMFSSMKMRNEKSLDGDEGPGAPPLPRDVRVNEKAIGNMGEDMVRYLLEAEYDDRGLEVGNVARSVWPYDLLVEDPKGGTVFGRRTAISVKTRMVASGAIPPGPGEVTEVLKRCRRTGMDFWIALLHYFYKDRRLAFGAYFVDAADLEKEDYVDVHGWGEEAGMLRVKNMRKKARLRLWSGD